MAAPRQIDPRIVKVTLEVNGQLKTYASPLFITANGMKYANALQNECDVVLNNLDRETQDYILTETSPYNLNRTPKTIRVEAGRQSYGTSLIYQGNIVTSSVTQPPDVGVTLKCLTGNFIKGNVITRNQPGSASLNQISQQINQDLGTILNFSATNKNIANYAFAGSALNQVAALNAMGGISAYVDDGVLVVKNLYDPRPGPLKIISASTGMIGIPEFTEQGLKVKFLIDNQTTLGGLARVISQQYPAANGDYVIYKLGFQISTRETPFYYIAEMLRIRRSNFNG